MVKSANDAAVALAEAVDGSEAAFVRRMNRKAAALRLAATHYVTPYGPYLAGDGRARMAPAEPLFPGRAEVRAGPSP